MNRDVPLWLRMGSMAVGLMFLILPLPAPLDGLRPHLLALALAYWTLESPGRTGLALAWCVGLLADVATGTLLGEQALRMAVMVYLVQRFRPQLRFFPLWQQSAAIGLMLVNDVALATTIRLIAGAEVPSLSVLLSPLMGMAAWPWWFLLLDSLRLRHRERVGGR